MARISLSRRVLFSLVLAALSLAAVEGIAAVALTATSGGWLSPAERRSERLGVAASADGFVDGQESAEEEPAPVARLVGAAEVLHPYLGFVRDPARAREEWRRVNELGFLEPARVERPTDPFRIAIFGGSVANNLAFAGRRLLTEGLAELAPAGRPIWVESYAMGGYKQPQQLMTLAYLLAIGRAPDLVINLDGYNEVVLPVADNLARDIHPFYPRAWSRRVEGLPDLAAQSLAGEIAFLTARRVERSRLCGGALAWSATCHLLWRALDRPLAAHQDELRRELAERRSAELLGERSFLAQGPEVGAELSEGDEGIYPRLAELWWRSSLAMSDLCRGRGIPYFHFLQPNQYVAGSKIMGAEERRRAIRRNHPYGRAAEKGYPVFIEAGEELRRAGVAYHDLTMVFREVSAPLYHDDCCHLNREGNRRLAEAIIDRIREQGRGSDAAGSGMTR